MLINTNPGFPHFYYILGANLGSLLHGDVSVMLQVNEPSNNGTFFIEDLCKKYHNHIHQQFINIFFFYRYIWQNHGMLIHETLELNKLVSSLITALSMIP